jgi:hypothetical protein
MFDTLLFFMSLSVNFNSRCQHWFCIMLAAVVQKQIDTHQYMAPAEGQQIRGRQPRQTKLGKLPRIIGLPLSVVESSGMGCGNRTGE